MKVWRIHYRIKSTGEVKRAPEGSRNEALIRRLCRECNADPDLDDRDHWVEEEDDAT